MTKQTMSDRDFVSYFDEGGDITEFIVADSVAFPNAPDKSRKFSISMPEWMIGELDATAKHLAVSRQAVINMWIGERLAQEQRSVLA